MQTLELLAPAKNFEFGKAVIDAGADAVFMGGPSFSARINARNTLAEIKQMVEYAHLFNAKVYVPLNTIIYDQEVLSAQDLIWDLYHLGVDALIVQDMGILEMDLPPIPLFASTQCHNHTIERVKFLEEVGFQRVILARELSLEQIKEIKSQTKVALEFFVHGALCVSYSGQCYFSQSVCQRSANRGECAQMCRLQYALEDADGQKIAQEKYLLSLKDFNLSAHLEELIDAGITSFKIEGRLKDIQYVKNITSLYRQKLDEIILKQKDYKRTSVGKSLINFSPKADKTFNRGFTDYFLHGRHLGILSPDTQKSLGEYLGEVTLVAKNFFEIKTPFEVHNADGICFFDQNQVLQGVNINRVDGKKIYPREMKNIFLGAQIYRNQDPVFNKDLDNTKQERKLAVCFVFQETHQGFELNAIDEEGVTITTALNIEKKMAQNPERVEGNIQKQLSKLGDTIFELQKIEIKIKQKYFIPISLLNDLRRQTCDLLILARQKKYKCKEHKIIPNNVSYPQKELDYHANIANRLAQQFYARHGAEVQEKAFELQTNLSGKDIMTTKHCLKYQFGLCSKQKDHKLVVKYPLYLVGQNKKYRLDFDCQNCVMKIILI